jgi:hypothetical protein
VLALLHPNEESEFGRLMRLTATQDLRITARRC